MVFSNIGKKTDHPLVSIIVHNYKGLEKLEACLNSLESSNYPNKELIVVDALTPNIKNWLEDNFQQVKLIHFDYDDGIPSRRNAGFQAKSPLAKYVLFMDEDIIVHKNCIAALVDVLESNPLIGAAQPLMLSSRLVGAIDSAGCYIDVFGFPHKIKKISSDQRNSKIYPVSYAETAIVLVRCDFFSKLPNINEPFDADYFVHWFDIDFSWKMLLAGYSIVLVLNAKVNHERGLSSGSGRLPAKNVFFNTRNKMITMIKNYSLLSLFKFFPLSFSLEVVKAFVLLKQKPSHSIAILRALLWVIVNIKSIIIKRYPVNNFVRQVSDAEVIQYFLPPNIIRLYIDLQTNYVPKF